MTEEEVRRALDNDVNFLRQDRDSWKAMAENADKRADHWQQAYFDMKEIAQSAIKGMVI